MSDVETNPNTTQAETKRSFWAKCAACKHVWPAAYYPMELSVMSSILMKAVCPNCGSKKVLIAKQHHGELQEHGSDA